MFAIRVKNIFNLFPEDQECFREIAFCDLKTKQKYTDLLNIYVLELKKLPPEKKDEPLIIKWMRFLSAEKKEDFEKMAGEDTYINEAYEVLGDKQKRQRYDSLGANWQGGQSYTPPPGFEQFGFGGGQGGYQSFNFNGQDMGGFSDFFSSLFGDMMGGGARGAQGMNFGGFDFGGTQSAGQRTSSRRRAAQEPKAENLDVTMNLNITIKDIFDKKPINVKFNNIERCQKCSGNGGYCSECGGTGFKTEPKSIKVKLPPDITEGQKLRVKGEGKVDAYGRKGDLYLVINIKDKEYEVDGSDLTKEVEITPPEAVLGCKKEIATLHGKIMIKIPPKTSSGQALRLKDLGLPKKGGGYGNLNAKIKIVIPKSLNDKQIELYKKIAEL